MNGHSKQPPGDQDEHWMRLGPFTATALSATLFSYGSVDGLGRVITTLSSNHRDINMVNANEPVARDA